jgi:hypothetical protein
VARATPAPAVLIVMIFGIAQISQSLLIYVAQWKFELSVIAVN